MENEKKFHRPKNQKSVYAAASIIYESLMNDEITVDKAEKAVNSLAQMNRAFALEIKMAEIQQKNEVRKIESTNFDENG